MTFDFVTETGGQRLKDRDAATRHLIRKRATQAAAATKKQQRRPGKIKPLQSLAPVDRTNGNALNGTNTEELSEGDALSIQREQEATSCRITSPHLYYSPSPACSAQQVVSLLSFLPVRGDLIGVRGFYSLTVKDKVKKGKIVHLTDSDFVSLLIDRYGHNATLDSAMDCLGARTRQLMSHSLAPSITKAQSPPWLYGRSLQLMKRDIDRGSWQGSCVEIWLAILLLALYELLNTSDQMAWILHARGAAKVLQQVGPGNITTEPCKTMLTIQTPICTNEALFSGFGCFLAEPEWQVALANTIVTGDPLGSRGQLYVTLMMLAARLPDLFNEVAGTVLGGDATGIFQLQSKIQILKAEFALWRIHWDTQLHPKCDDIGSEDNWCRRHYSLVYSLVYSAITDRLLLAITPYRVMELEQSACDLAEQALEAANATGLPTRGTGVIVAYILAVGEAITATSCQWRLDLSLGDDRTTVHPEVFSSWCRTLGRPVP
jgi:hypothetical protein